jgi:hypothetical protein
MEEDHQSSSINPTQLNKNPSKEKRIKAKTKKERWVGGAMTARGARKQP